MVVVKDYDGDIRPSEMVLNTIETWVQVTGLPLDKRFDYFGKALGNWLWRGGKRGHGYGWTYEGETSQSKG